MLYAVLRQAHTILAYLFFLTFLAHFGAILFHTLIVRDGILKRIAPWNIRSQQAAATEQSALLKQAAEVELEAKRFAPGTPDSRIGPR
jgi:hypothetical protein